MISMPCITYAISLSPCSRPAMPPNESWCDLVLNVSVATTDDSVVCGDVGAFDISLYQSQSQQWPRSKSYSI